MKAVRIEAYGGPDVIAITEVDPREPGAGEVRVRNHAIGVNFIEHVALRMSPLISSTESSSPAR